MLCVLFLKLLQTDFRPIQNSLIYRNPPSGWILRSTWAVRFINRSHIYPHTPQQDLTDEFTLYIKKIPVLLQLSLVVLNFHAVTEGKHMHKPWTLTVQFLCNRLPAPSSGLLVFDLLISAALSRLHWSLLDCSVRSWLFADWADYSQSSPLPSMQNQAKLQCISSTKCLAIN